MIETFKAFDDFWKFYNARKIIWSDKKWTLFRIDEYNFRWNKSEEGIETIILTFGWKWYNTKFVYEKLPNKDNEEFPHNKQFD